MATDKKVAELEEQLGQCEDELEKVILEKDQVEQEKEKYIAMYKDQEMKIQAMVLDKELENVEMQRKMLEASLQGELLEDKDTEIGALKSEVSQYKEAFDTLQIWHVDCVTKLNAREAELAELIEVVQTMQFDLKQTEERCATDEGEIKHYQEIMDCDANVLNQLNVYNQEMEEYVNHMEREIKAYKSGWDQLSQMAINKERERKVEVTSLSKKLTEAENKVKTYENFIAPRWKRLAQESITRGPTNHALELRADIRDVQTNISVLKMKFMDTCVPKELWVQELVVYNNYATVHECLHRCMGLLDYLRKAHYEDLYLDSQDNEDSVKKDVGFIRWLHQTCTRIAKIAELLCMYVSALRRADAATLRRINEPEGELTKQVHIANIFFDRMVQSAQQDFLSSALQSDELDDVITSLQNYTECSENMSIFEPVYERFDTGVLNTYIHRAVSMCVLGMCKATFNKASALAIVEEWQDIWTRIEPLLNTGQLSVECDTTFTAGFANMRPIREEETSQQFRNKMKDAIQCIDDSITSIKEQPPMEIAGIVAPNIKTLITCLEDLTKMLAGTPKASEHGLNPRPWNDLSSAVCDKLENVTQLEFKVAEALQSKKEAQNANEELIQKAQVAEDEANGWKKSYTESQLRAQQCVLMEKEVHQLRGSERQLVDLLDTTRNALNTSSVSTERLTKENAEMKTKLEDVKKSMEAQKKIPKHQSQSEWDAHEIAHLRAIVKKQDAEIYMFEMNEIKENLDAADLEVFAKHVDNDLTNQESTTADDASSASSESSADEMQQELVDLKEEAETDLSRDIKEAFRMLEEYRQLQQSIWLHTFTIPVWTPSLSNQENENMRKRYQSDHHALMMKLVTLRKRLNKYLLKRLESENISSGFGEHAAVAANRYMKGFTDLSRLPLKTCKEKSQTEDTLLPVGRVTVPHPPSWLQDHSDGQKVVLTEDQLGALHKKLAVLD